MTNQKELPWAFLDAWRGKTFTGEWPTIPEMFRITVERYSDRNCFTVFEPDRNTLTYKQVLANVEKLSYWLYEQGIRAGDRVAVTQQTFCLQFVVVFVHRKSSVRDSVLSERHTRTLRKRFLSVALNAL